MSNVSDILNSMRVIDESEYEDEMETGGQGSKYSPFYRKAKQLDPGQIFKSEQPVTETTLQGIRRAVYKLNNSDSEGEREYEVERRKLYEKGEPKTNSDGDEIFIFYIKRSE